MTCVACLRRPVRRVGKKFEGMALFCLRCSRADDMRPIDHFTARLEPKRPRPHNFPAPDPIDVAMRARMEAMLDLLEGREREAWELVCAGATEEQMVAALGMSSRRTLRSRVLAPLFARVGVPTKMRAATREYRWRADGRGAN